jgi:hypothetical protein
MGDLPKESWLWKSTCLRVLFEPTSVLKKIAYIYMDEMLAILSSTGERSLTLSIAMV